MMRTATVGAVVLVIAWRVLSPASVASAEFFSGHFFYVSRLIGALLIATLVPLLIDRHFRR
jgi:hypothetical protein